MDRSKHYKDGPSRDTRLLTDLGASDGYLQQDRPSREAHRRGLPNLTGQFQALIEAIPDIVYFKDRKGVNLIVNHAYERFLGMKKKDIIGKSDAQLLPSDLARCCRKSDEQVMKGRRTLRFEERFVNSNGDIRYFDSVKSPLFNDQGDLMGLVGISRDVTEFKIAEEELHKSEEKYRILFDNAADLIAVVDAHGNILEINRKIQEEGGYDQEEVVGMNAFSSGILTKPSSVKAASHLKELLSGKEWLVFEVEGVRKDGTLIPYELRAVPIKKEGKICAVQAILRNITERKRAEKALRESEEKYRNLVERANDGIAIIQENLLKYVNPRLAEMAGYGVEEVIDTPFIQHIYPDEVSKVVDYHRRRMGGEEAPFTYKAGLMCKNGDRLEVEFNAGVITYEGKPAAFAIVRDLTERHRAEEEKRKLEAQLEQAKRLEAIGTLAGGVAHDFNNLLTAIQGNVSLILCDLDPSAPAFELLKNIERQIDSGAKLTSQLLGYARKGRFHVRPLNLNQLVRRTSEAFGRTRKQIRVEHKLEEGLLAVKADQGQLEQMLLNLYINAADAMPEGGSLVLGTANVTHKAMKKRPYDPKPGHYVQLTVADTGTGMSKETQGRVFEPFFTTKEMGRGTGLGLASVYGVIKGHGGYIDVESEEGCGTTFNIYLPASTQPVQEASEPEDPIACGSGTVLLVDDEHIVLEVGARMLEKLGYNVIKAGGGKEAIKIYSENKENIDLVILDMIMPDMGGGKVYDRMTEVNPRVKVLLSSGYSIEGQAGEILKRGCDGFLQKPFTLKELSSQMGKILRKKNEAP